VAVRAVHYEPGVVVAGIRGWQGRDGLGYLGGSDRVVNMPRGHLPDRDRPGDLDQPGLGEADIVHHLRVRHLNREHDAAPWRTGVAEQ